MEAEELNLDALPIEFLNLPQADMETRDEAQTHVNAHIFMTMNEENPKRRLMRTVQSWQNNNHRNATTARNDDDVTEIRTRLKRFASELRQSRPEVPVDPPESASALFASHGSYGVVDLGATKTVIGSHKVAELINS